MAWQSDNQWMLANCSFPERIPRWIGRSGSLLGKTGNPGVPRFGTEMPASKGNCHFPRRWRGVCVAIGGRFCEWDATVAR